MKITLAAALSVNGNLSQNLNKIEAVLRAHPDQDFVLFGEAFLQGFNSLTFDPDHDQQWAVDHSDAPISWLRDLARTVHSGIGVGYFRFHQGKWTSNYLIISNQGDILLDYARMSPGWKIRDADPQLYTEGTQSGIFHYHGKQIGVLLCGDGWTDEVVSAMVSRQPDLVFWPVYVCFPLAEWKQEQAEAYALQAGSFAKRVVLVNNLDAPGVEEPALGGAFDIQNGQIQASLPWTEEGCLTLEIPE